LYEFGLDESPPRCLEEIVPLVLDALETACLVDGDMRLVLMPRTSVDAAFLCRHGYAPIADGCAGTWFIKPFSS
jgi:hypothetical protein